MNAKKRTTVMKTKTTTTQTVEHISTMVAEEIVPGRIWTLDGAFSQEDCARLIRLAEQNGFRTPQATRLAVDTRSRCKFYDEAATTQLTSFLSKMLPAQLHDGSTFVGARDQVRIYCYAPGERFEPHIDGGARVKRGRHLGQYSVYTYVLYLNDDRDGLIGGATRFIDVPQWPTPKSTGILPRRGRILVFKQRHTKHEGCAVVSGYKYIVQGMVMYQRPAYLKEKGIMPLSCVFEKVIERQSPSEKVSPSPTKKGLPLPAAAAKLRGKDPRRSSLPGMKASFAIMSHEMRMKQADELASSYLCAEPYLLSYLHRNQLVGERVYRMLKAGICPAAVLQKLSLYSKYNFCVLREVVDRAQNRLNLFMVHDVSLSAGSCSVHAMKDKKEENLRNLIQEPPSASTAISSQKQEIPVNPKKETSISKKEENSSALGEKLAIAHMFIPKYYAMLVAGVPANAVMSAMTVLGGVDQVTASSEVKRMVYYITQQRDLGEDRLLRDHAGATVFFPDPDDY